MIRSIRIRRSVLVVLTATAWTFPMMDFCTSLLYQLMAKGLILVGG
jgi:hypothetical protein